MVFKKPFGRIGIGRSSTWVRTALIGIVGGILFGLIIQFWMEDMIVVGMLYGVRTTVGGWVAHLFHSVVGSFIFAGIINRTPFRDHMKNTKRTAGFGLIYGLILWIILMKIIIPAWLNMTPVGGGTPLIDTRSRFPASFIGFLAYGLVVSASVQLSASTKEGSNNTS